MIMSLSKIVIKEQDSFEDNIKTPKNVWNKDSRKDDISPFQYVQNSGWWKSEMKNKSFFDSIREEMGEDIWTSGIGIEDLN